MSVHRPDREFASRSLDDVVGAFQVDGSWYERHWYGPETVRTAGGRSLVRRPGAGLVAVSLLVAWVTVLL